MPADPAFIPAAGLCLSQRKPDAGAGPELSWAALTPRKPRPPPDDAGGPRSATSAARWG